MQAAANNSVAKKKKAAAGKIEDELSQFAGVASQVASAQIRLTKKEESAQKMERALQSRYYWINLVNDIQGVLSRLEPEVYIVTGPNELAAITNRVDELVAQYEAENGVKPQGVANAEAAIWIQSLTSTQPTLTIAASGGSGNPESGMGSGGGSMGPPGGGMMGGNPENSGLGGGGFQALFSGGSAEPTEREPIEVVYVKLRAKNILPRERETQNREYTQLVAKLFRQNGMFSESEEETKVIGAIPNVDSKERWFDFIVQLKLTDPIVLKDEELE